MMVNFYIGLCWLTVSALLSPSYPRLLPLGTGQMYSYFLVKSFDENHKRVISWIQKKINSFIHYFPGFYFLPQHWYPSTEAITTCCPVSKNKHQSDLHFHECFLCLNRFHIGFNLWMKIRVFNLVGPIWAELTNK